MDDAATPAPSLVPAPVAKRSGWSRAVARLLVLAGLTGLAIAQPVLDIFGDSPQTFTVNRLTGGHIVAFGLAVVLVPPLAFWALGQVVDLADRRVGKNLHFAMVGVLAAIAGVGLAKEVTGIAAVQAVVGVALGVGVVIAYRRLDAVYVWLRVLAVANLVFLALFLFTSPVADSLKGSQEALEVEFIDEDPPSLVMLVFDEWSTQSIMSADGELDEVRFPNLARFADDSTWYRRHSTVSPFTQSAVPALLDGLNPMGEPIWQDHPENLFSLLASSHNLSISESITSLCGFDDCGLVPQPLPLASDATDTAAPVDLAATGGPRWSRMREAAFDVFADRARPGGGSADLAGFSEELVVAQTPVSGTETDPEVETTPETTIDPNRDLVAEQELAAFLATQVSGQPDRHRAFIEALRPTDEPFFSFLHLILPHQPWTLLPDGSKYSTSVPDEGGLLPPDEWSLRIIQQRHLLQASYADRLLGLILDRLDEIDAYDDTTIVVVADHGVGFEVDDSPRTLSDQNLAEIAYAPLFIKAAGQTTGAIDDANVLSVDVVPTVAELLGTEVPWRTDGVPIGSAAAAERGDEKYIYSFTDAYDYTFLGIETFDDTEGFDNLLVDVFGPVSVEESLTAALTRDVTAADTIGTSAIDAFASPAPGSAEVTAEVIGLSAIVEPEPNELPRGDVLGWVSGAPADATAVVVAIDDRIVAVSPLFERDGRAGAFSVLLPQDALRDAESADAAGGLRIAVATGDAAAPQLVEVTVVGS